MSVTFANFLYLIAGVCFIMALRSLSSATTSRTGNMYGIFGMAIAILTTMLLPSIGHYTWIIAAVAIGGVVGTLTAKKIKMTALPQLIAFFHSLVGLSAVFVAASTLYNPEGFFIGTAEHIQKASLVEMSLGSLIGAITFSGSIIAFVKLQGLIKAKPLIFNKQHYVNSLLGIILIALIIGFIITQSHTLFWLIIVLALALGTLLILPIGGADMPVVISMLNSYSGWAAAGIGFTLNNYLLIITGALVGASGVILSYIMCKGMNRSIFNVLLGGFGINESTTISVGAPDKPVKISSPEDAANILSQAKSVIVVPGYGMAVAQAQYVLKDLTKYLKDNGAKVRYAIHPVAGRMPGHMNVLLAEANVDYEEVLELEEINADFANTDVAFVIGANDITNPAAKNNPQSPIYGMPILDVEKAKTVFFVKRSLAPGYAGIENDLFYQDNTLMLLGDGKKVCEELIKALKSAY